MLKQCCFPVQNNTDLRKVFTDTFRYGSLVDLGRVFVLSKLLMVCVTKDNILTLVFFDYRDIFDLNFIPLSIYLLKVFGHTMCATCGILVPSSGIKPVYPALAAQSLHHCHSSLNHWTPFLL